MLIMSLIPANSTELEMEVGRKQVPTPVMDRDGDLWGRSTVPGSLASEAGRLHSDSFSPSCIFLRLLSPSHHSALKQVLSVVLQGAAENKVTECM